MINALVLEIQQITHQICDDDLTRLRLEEELLVTFIKNKSGRLNEKKEAIERVKLINKMQLKLLGEQ